MPNLLEKAHTPSVNERVSRGLTEQVCKSSRCVSYNQRCGFPTLDKFVEFSLNQLAEVARFGQLLQGCIR